MLEGGFGLWFADKTGWMDVHSVPMRRGVLVEAAFPPVNSRATMKRPSGTIRHHTIFHDRSLLTA